MARNMLNAETRTLLAMLLCPLSLWERVRVRVPGECSPREKDKRTRPSYTAPALSTSLNERREQDDGLSRRIRAGAGVGRGHAGPDACHRRAHHRLDRPLYSGGPTRHRSGFGP